MFWALAVLNIAIYEHVVHNFLTKSATWYLALDAKYLAVACVLQALLSEIRNKPLAYRSVIALLCIGSWVDLAGQLMWHVCRFDSSVPVFLIFSLWFVLTARRAYEVRGDIVLGDNVFIMLLRPVTNWDVCKALFGFPTASVCVYARGCIWSFRAKTGTYDVYPVTDAWLRRHIALNTGVLCTDDLQYQLDRLCGTSRWPGVKCVWVLRKFLKNLGAEYAPRWFDYVPGFYALKLLWGK